MNKRSLTADVMDLLARIRAITPSEDEQELLAVAINAILFITSTGQQYAFADFLEHHLGRLKREGLSPAVASFKTREEAESWFMCQTEPPEQSFITVAGDSYLAVYHRNVHHRALYPFSIALDEEEQGEGDAQEPR